MNGLAPLANTAKIIKKVKRQALKNNDPSVLPSIYNDNINIAIWQRDITPQLASAVSSLIKTNALKPVELALSPEDAYKQLTSAIKAESTNQANINTLCKDIALLVEMFCCLFDLKRAGLRLTVLTRPMCPRFHVDRIPCRLVSTYQGAATQWLNHNQVDRTKLGAGNLGKPDEESGLFKSASDINQLNKGDVALLKGEFWDDNEGAGLVHRSAPTIANEERLLLTLDFI